MKSDDKILYFTSSTSTTMPFTDGNVVAYTGLYKCTFIENDEDYDSIDGNDQQQCRETRKVANGFDRDGPSHAALPLHNLQFHSGNRERKKSKKNDEIKIDSFSSSRPSYLYANTYIDKRRENPDVHVGNWEILRAKFPGDVEENGSDGLHFESVFRTLEAFDWNECGFKCCPYNSNSDDDPFQYSKDEENNYFSHTHAYVRTIPRSFAVDDTTGEIFVSWEGFYQNCDPANLVEEKQLQWTIGISRLRAEDPYCVTDQVHVMENNFPRCTEPVSIVYQSSHGRDVVLPKGGFTVVPATDGVPRRSFLLSALKTPEIHGRELESHVWAVPEGGIRDQEQISLSGNGTSIDNLFMDEGVWDGGTLRLHYNPQTGLPDHLCRSIFNKGIGCMPISVNATGDNLSSVSILPQGKEDILLTDEEVLSFCRLKDADRSDRLYWGRRTTLVTGLEIVWNEEEDGTGSPRRVLFGCFGGEMNDGNFGMLDVDRTQKESTAPIQVMKGAYPGAMLFLPQDLEQLLTSSIYNSTFTDSTAPSTILRKYKLFSTKSCSMFFAFLLLCILSLKFFSRGRRSKRYYPVKSQLPINGNEEKQYFGSLRIDTSYVELPNVDSLKSKWCASPT
jgi:hypothetical protein